MNQDWYNLLVQVAAIIISLIGGVSTVPVINWVKGQLNLDGRWAQVLTAAVATIIAILTMVVQGALAPGTVTAENLSVVFTAVLVASQAEYARIRRQEKES